MAFNSTPHDINEQNINGLLSCWDEWERVELSQVAKVVNGFAFKSKEFNANGEGNRLIRIRDVLKGDTETYYTGDVPVGFWVVRDDIIVGMDGDFNIAWWKSEAALLNQRVCKVDITSTYFDKKLFFRLLPGYLDAINANTSSTTVKHLSSKTLEGLFLPLPPLAEQKIIADKLDTLLAQVETSKARLERIPKILKTFRQSVLAAAVSGKLTEQWREENKASSLDVSVLQDELFSKGLTHGNFGKKLAKSPLIDSDELDLVVHHIEGWPLVRVGAICQSVVPNRDKPKKFSGGYHWLLTPHFKEHSIWIDYSKIEHGLSEQEVREYKAKVIRSNNVIMTCVGRVGLSAVLEEDAVINQQLHAFIVNKFIKSEYLAYCIRANVKYFEAQATSTTVSYLNKTSCNSLPIPLPAIEEQTEIVRRVEELFAFADRIEQKANAALERVSNLTQSILAKAFRGELTADWRAANPELISGENSAEALLKKIKAERAALNPKKKTRI